MATRNFIAIDVLGVQELREMFKDLPPAIEERVVGRGAREIALEVRRDLRAATPKFDTGRLSESWRFSAAKRLRIKGERFFRVYLSHSLKDAHPTTKHAKKRPRGIAPGGQWGRPGLGFWLEHGTDKFAGKRWFAPIAAGLEARFSQRLLEIFKDGIRKEVDKLAVKQLAGVKRKRRR